MKAGTVYKFDLVLRHDNCSKLDREEEICHIEVDKQPGVATKVTWDCVSDQSIGDRM